MERIRSPAPVSLASPATSVRLSSMNVLHRPVSTEDTVKTSSMVTNADAGLAHQAPIAKSTSMNAIAILVEMELSALTA